jgi:hypothetical protein
VKKVNKTKKILRYSASFVMAALAIIAMAIMVSADGGIGGAAPADVNTDSMKKIIGIVFWGVRLLIGGAGGIPSIIKIVQGTTDENPRDRNAGITGMIATGAGIAATFALEKMFG